MEVNNGISELLNTNVPRCDSSPRVPLKLTLGADLSGLGRQVTHASALGFNLKIRERWKDIIWQTHVYRIYLSCVGLTTSRTAVVDLAAYFGVCMRGRQMEMFRVWLHPVKLDECGRPWKKAKQKLLGCSVPLHYRDHNIAATPPKSLAHGLSIT